MDFLNVEVKNTAKGIIEIVPDFITKKSKDLMIRGNNFYAVWDEENQIWSKDEYRCIQLIDAELKKRADEVNAPFMLVRYLRNTNSGSIKKWKDYIKKYSTDNFVPLDSTLVFSNTEKKRELYSSHSLSYALAPGDYSAYNQLISILYSPEEKEKLEWIIGSIVTGDSKKIQKFIVLTGEPGTGKGTVIDKIICKLFDGYCAVVDGAALGNPSASFPLESLKDNPLVAYEGDTKLDKIKSNTTLNALISHEPIVVNEKYSKKYPMRFSCMLVFGSNQEVNITDSRSGLLRRLIDVRPTGKIIPTREYNKLIKRMEFELGAIAWHCKEVYESDPEKFLSYRPTKSIRATNYTYNFLEENYFEYKDGVGLQRLWLDYQKYCENAGIIYKMNKLELKQEVSAYFKKFLVDSVLPDGSRVRNYFCEIRPEKLGFKSNVVEVKDGSGDSDSRNDTDSVEDWLDLKEQHSLLDDLFADFPAQYAKLKDGSEVPIKSWDNVKTTLKDIDTSKVHYVLPDSKYIEFDLDLRNEKGEKDFDLNVKAVKDMGLPKTYVETSKGGQGLHLIYIYPGDVSNLAFLYDENVEIKVHLGKASMRRKVTRCNDIPVATITSGLPLKGGKKMVDNVTFANERHLRRMIIKNLKKEILPHTVESIGLIDKDLRRAYDQGLKFDVTDLSGDILDFAMNSTNSAKKCIDIVSKMKFKSDEPTENKEAEDDRPIVFFDVEVYKNLLIVCWKYLGVDDVVKMINPKIDEVENLFKFRLVGFNNRRYDNHILWAYTMGYKNEALYELSQSIISNERIGTFSEAYNLSYTDIWDYASNKQSLKKWEIQLGITHMEMGIPWDEPAPENMWNDIAEYCANDVRATEAVWNATKSDFKAREILADLAGMTVNDTTNKLTLAIVFGKEKHPKLIYTDLSKLFPGYEFVKEYVTDDKGKQKLVKKNMYRGTDVGFGGYVYAEPGMYTDVALLDVASMHPTSIIMLNKLGEYTENYKNLRDARIYIKHRDYDKVRHMFDGKLSKYLTSDNDADELSKALKLPINSFYGLSSAGFDNPARDWNDENNIIALRGALFMRTLQDELKERGYPAVHFKTDSCKIPNASPEIIEFVMEFGRKYGYEFEHEATYKKMCLVNGSTYIAKYDDKGIRNKGSKHANEWTATAAQFQVPYVFKTLFSHEKIEFEDLCETKSVQRGALYLDFNENLPEGEHDYRFIGRVGRFCPIKKGCGGAELFRFNEGKYYAATGTKGFRWMDAEVIKNENLDYEKIVDRTYYDIQVDEAVIDISKYGDFEWFVSDDDGPMPEDYKFEEVNNDPLEGLMNKPE